jgi:hypothetical protein
MTELTLTTSTSQRSGRWILLALAGVCLLPLMLALYFRYVAPPAVTPMAGKPLTPFVFPYASVQQMDGQRLAPPGVSGQWWVVVTGAGACNMACRDVLYLTRQARTAQGRNMERLQRVWILTDATRPSAELLASHPDLQLLLATDERVVRLLGGETDGAAAPIHLVDRRGYVVFRYEATVAPGAFIRELGKLVRF